MNNYILPFAKISKKDVKIAGGKGASLGEMSQAGLPVPSGFVVLARAFDDFLTKTPPPVGPGQDLNVYLESELNKVNYQDVNSIDKAANVIRDMILDSEMPADIKKAVVGEFKKLGAKWVAVRSSATAEDSKTASWAGELETFLYVNEKNLIESVKKCWSSLFTPRAIFYRFEKN